MTRTFFIEDGKNIPLINLVPSNILLEKSQYNLNAARTFY
jgi:hypothetical protein